MTKILVADDDPLVAEIVRAIARPHRWQVIMAADAMQAVMFAMRDVPDLVLLDINMPGGTGVTSLQRLKASMKTAAVPVIVQSGNQEPGMKEKVLGMGAEAFLPKPVDPVALEAALRETIERFGAL